MKTLLAITLALALCGGISHAIAQERPKPTLVEMNKDLKILNLQLRVKQLEYHDLKDRRDGLVAQVKKAESDYNDMTKRRSRLQRTIQQLSKPVKPVKIIPGKTDEDERYEDE